MKMINKMCLAALALCLAGTAQAADIPQRKSGLWEMKISISQMPSLRPIQLCVDAASDNLIDQGGIDPKQCSKKDVKLVGDRYDFSYQCKAAGTTITTTGSFSGNFSTQYSGVVKSHYSPARNGMTEATMNVEGRYLGACQVNQKPGEVILPGGMMYNPSGAKDAQRQMTK